MLKRFVGVTMLVIAMAVTLSLVSCADKGTSSSASADHKVTYKCLSSSCDASVTCNPGDPVPMHCGKPMIK
jgi:hypothetical protein